MNMNMKIAIIEPIGGNTGNEIYDFCLVRAINNEENCRATLYTCNLTNIDGIENVKLTYKNIWGKKHKFIRAFNYVMGSIRTLLDAKKNNVSIIHLHIFNFDLLEYFDLFMAKKLFGFHVVATLHDIESFKKYAKGDASRQNYEKFLSLFDGVVFHTEYACRELLKHVTSDVMDTRKIRTIYGSDFDYNFMHTKKIEKNIARKHLGLPQNRKIVLFFGMIKKVKGLDLLLEALAKLKNKEPLVMLVIAGNVWRDDFSDYERIINQHGLEPYVEQRIRFIDNEDVPYYFDATDVVVLPYRKIYNSGVLIRAMSFGTPILASNFGPFKEFIEEGKNGYLFETDNAESLAIKLLVMLDDETSLEKISQAEKEFIKENFSLDKLGEQYRELYQSILEVRV